MNHIVRPMGAGFLGLILMAGNSLGAVTATMARPEQTGSGHRFACVDYSGHGLFIVSTNGLVAWKMGDIGTPNDLWVLPNGNLLFNTGHGVREVNQDKKVVFEYKTTSEVYTCQRLPNGNTFVGECNAGRLLDVAPDGSIVKEIRLLPSNANGGHLFMRNARRLPNGHTLVTLYGAQVVKEYDADGKELRSIPAPGGPHSVVALPNGHVLIATGDRKAAGGPRVFEVDPAGKVVWEVKNGDLPGIKFAFMTGLHRLPNGNTVMSNWLGHGKFGTAPQIIEVTPDKKVVWTFADHNTMRTISSIQVLDVEGDAIKGTIAH